MTRAEYEDAYDTAMVVNPQIMMPTFETLERGGIVGSVEIVDCVEESDSAWFEGRFGFLLRDPRPLPFLPCKGQLGLFRHDFPFHEFIDGNGLALLEDPFLMFGQPWGKA